MAQKQPGDAFTEETLRRMREISRKAAYHPLVMEAARAITRSASERDYHGQAQLIREWLKRKIRFVRDPRGTELLTDPAVMLQRVSQDARGTYGDCDDVATLGAALGLSIGMPARFLAIAFEREDAPYQHVYAELSTNRGMVDLDTTRTSQYLSRVVSRRLAVPI